MDKDFLKLPFHARQGDVPYGASALRVHKGREIAYGRLKAASRSDHQDLAEASGLTFRVARGVVERLWRGKDACVRRPRIGTVVICRATS